MENVLSWFQPAFQSKEAKEISPQNRRISFEDMKHAQKNDYLLINTLPLTNQACLIKGTTDAAEEEDMINEMIAHDEMDRIIVVYGSNSCDTTTEKKLQELCDVGFRRVYIYSGGLFEWLLLQDIYGEAEFTTTAKIVDLLAYQPSRRKF